MNADHYDSENLVQIQVEPKRHHGCKFCQLEEMWKTFIDRNSSVYNQGIFVVSITIMINRLLCLLAILESARHHLDECQYRPTHVFYFRFFQIDFWIWFSNSTINFTAMSHPRNLRICFEIITQPIKIFLTTNARLILGLSHNLLGLSATLTNAF